MEKPKAFTSIQVAEEKGRSAWRSYRAELIVNIDGETETFVREFATLEEREKAVKHMIRFCIINEIEIECC